jgi:predicted DCC family thiol-disulfide oxidoreductase YuxK
MLYDGGCPLCMREVNFLKQRDGGSGKVDFVDVDDRDYSPAQNAGLDYEEAMAGIHAIDRDGTVYTKVCCSVKLLRPVRTRLGKWRHIQVAH